MVVKKCNQATNVTVICSLEDVEQSVREEVVRVQSTRKLTQRRGASLPVLRYHVKLPGIRALCLGVHV